ncbi:chaperone protein DnaK-like [Thrips palmi]|uniref:Chaperone protein DnaK-like n=1 Tax=Thrips palmi TaxID=161013 RepID=A0A6P8ZCX3_THRPL|nr:chaperone protein DnaK-like [Thrips palmi]
MVRCVKVPDPTGAMPGSTENSVVMKPSGDGPVVGIDLGTTYSVVAVYRRGKVEIFSNDNGSRTTPSVVGFMDGESFVGEAAKDLPASNQVYDAKRLIGRPWKDEKVQSDRKSWPFEVFEEKGAPRIRVDVGGKKETFAPEEISAMVLRNLKETAEGALGEPVNRAVITVPAYFDERQRQATRAAGRIAGLEVVAMINEPTAGAIAYGLDKKSAKKKTVFVYDLGGGTFDVSVMVIEGSEFKVLASGGDTHLGGQDFDLRLVCYCVEEIRRQHGVDLAALQDKQSLQDLRKACELAKRMLSSLHEAPISVFLTRHQIGYNTKISRARFENLCADLFKKTVDITNEVLADAEVSHAAIDEVVLVGGSTRIPKVRSMLSKLFGGKELCRAINPDEAVAYGAAVHAAALSGDKFAENLVKLKDVTPLSLGVEIIGGRFSPLIKKNSPIPCRNTEKYYTCHDNQTQMTSKVYQGERPLVKDNHCLNKKYTIEVPPRPAGESSIDVTFEIDTDGLLTVTAVEPTTKKQVQVKITKSEAHLSEKDIQDMMEKAKRFQREDAEELRRVEESLRNQRLWPVVGIDLGTTFSVVAMYRRGKVEIFANDNGSRTTPSVVGFMDGESFVGEAAKDLPASKQIYDAKRLIGRPWRDDSVQSGQNMWPFKVVEDNGAPRIQVDVGDEKETFTPEEISAMVLRDLKETAENALGEPVSKAVITVPAYFNERQRQATRNAGRIAGLEVVAMINEPTAGAIAYGLDKKSAKKKTVFVYDLGGGTFDVSVMVIEGSEFKVLASGGDTHLGGQDFDARLLKHCVEEIRTKHDVDLEGLMDYESLHDLRKACTLAKCKLSNPNYLETSLRIYFPRHEIGYSTKISRKLFATLCADLFQKTIDLSSEVLAEAEVIQSDIDEVVLVGGSTRIPKVRAMLSELFGGKELCRAINPDEAVAYGAAVHAAVLSGDESVEKLVKLRDVTPLSLGTDLVGGRFSAVIKRNRTIPCSNTITYCTAFDYQTSITSDVYQGECPLYKDNYCLNKKFTVDVPSKPSGEATIDVTFEIDSDGLLTVTAVEPTTKKQAQVKITRKEAHPSEQDIQDMMEKVRRFTGKVTV